MARLQAAAHSASALSLHRAGSASLESSMHGGASALLPVATPYSQRLAQLFDRLQLKPGTLSTLNHGWLGDTLLSCCMNALLAA
jgi:hypothetical protein